MTLIQDVRVAIATATPPPAAMCYDTHPANVLSACCAVQVCAAWFDCDPSSATAGSKWQSAWEWADTHHASLFVWLRQYGLSLRVEHSTLSSALPMCAEALARIGITGFGDGTVYTPYPLALAMARQAHMAVRHIPESLQTNPVWFDPAAGSGVLCHAMNALGADMHASDVSLTASLVHRVWAGRARVRHGDSLTHPWLQESLFADEDTWHLPEPSKHVFGIIANPPYGILSLPKSHPSEDMLRGKWDVFPSLWECAGIPIQDASTRSLKDGCARFLRWAVFACSQHPAGVFSFVVNHTILGASPLRGLRHTCMQACSHLWITHLHGDRRATFAATDESIFGIQVGISIITGVVAPHAKPCVVQYQSIVGTREQKLERLGRDMDEWHRIHPQVPAFQWLPSEVDIHKKHLTFDQAWQYSAVGFKTGADKVVLQDTAEQLNTTIENIMLHRSVGGIPRTWDVNVVRKSISHLDNPEHFYRQVLCAPFDVRWTLWHPETAWIDAMSQRILQHLAIPGNRAIITRSEQRNGIRPAVWCADIPVHGKAVDYWNGSATFPLYLLPVHLEHWGERTSNCTTELQQQTCEAWQLQWQSDGAGDMKTTYGPDDLWHYLYALLHAHHKQPIQQDSYASIPLLPRSIARELIAAGKSGSAIHLMHTTPDMQPYVGLPQATCGDLAWDADSLHHTGQIAMAVSVQAWQWKIGSYQVIKAWLNARKHLVATEDRMRRLQQVVAWVEQDIAWRSTLPDLHTYL